MFDNEFIDEFIYEKINEEISGNNIRQGLWTKALAVSEYNEKKAKSQYIKYRYKALKKEINEEIRLEKESIRQAEKQQDYNRKSEEKLLQDSYKQEEFQQGIAQINDLMRRLSVINAGKKERKKIRIIWFLSISVIALIYFSVIAKETNVPIILSTFMSLLTGIVSLAVLEMYLMFVYGSRQLAAEARKIIRDIKKIELTSTEYVFYLLGQWAKTIITVLLMLFIAGLIPDIINSITDAKRN